MSDVPLLEVADLHAYYGSSHVLHGIDLFVRSGEAIGLMGRNGMGKTTLLRSIAGLVRPRASRMRIAGRDALPLMAHAIARRGVAYVPEGRGIFSNLTVRENLLMAARAGVDGSERWTYERILAMFPNLQRRITHLGSELSGGEQQMLTLGRALMTNPRLLLLDEAAEGLAPLVAREIWRNIADICASGIAALIVDKDFRAVTNITSRNILLVKGRIAFEGSSVELRQRTDVLQQYLGI